jgi:hypothetical protein
MKRLASRALVVLAATSRHPLFAFSVPGLWVATAARKEKS